MTGVSFFVKAPMVAKVSSIVVAVIGAIVSFLLIGGIKKKILEPTLTLLENTHNLNESLDATLHDLFEAPEEMEQININLKKIASQVKKTYQELVQLKEYHQKDLDMIEDLYKAAFEKGTLQDRIFNILPKICKYCGFSKFFAFVREPSGTLLKRIGKPEEKTPLMGIPVKEENNPFAKLVKVKSPQIIKLKGLQDLTPHQREWIEKNNLNLVYPVPVKIDEEVMALLLFALDERKEFTRAQKIILSFVVEVISDMFRHQEQITQTIAQYSALEVENNIYKSLIDVKGMEEMAVNFLNAFSQFMPMDWGAISVFDEEENAFIMYSTSTNGGGRLIKSVIQIKGSGIEWVKENRRSWVEEDLTVAQPFQEDEIYIHEGLKARIISPLYSEKRFIGTLSVASKEAGVYEHQHVRVVEKMARLLGNVIENSKILSVLKNKVEDLKKANKNLEKFFYNLAHDLRHPVLKLDKMLQTLPDKKDISPEEAYKIFTNITKDVQNLKKSLEDVMDYSKAEIGRLQFNPENLYLIEVLKDVLWGFKDEAQRKMISLKLDIPKTMPEILADRDKLRSIFSELIENAIRHTPVRGTITIKANLIPKSWLKEKAKDYFPPPVAKNIDTSVDHVLISVTDTGVGIPFEKQKSLFKTLKDEPDKEIQEGRLGMGLPRVKRLVEVHQGYIWVASKEGKGTRFSFNIPQYGRSWVSLRKVLHDKIQQAKEELSSVTVIVINIKGADDLRERVGVEKYGKVVRDMEEIVKGILRDSEDIVRRFYDDETIVVISKSDMEASHIIKDRIKEHLSKIAEKEIKGEFIQFQINSLTYPDEVFTVDQLLSGLDEMVKKSKKELEI